MVAMAKKRDNVADNRKYGFPVSGRVPEGAASKLRREALKSGISMSKMVALVISQWASGEDLKEDIKTYSSENENLKSELRSCKKSLKKWDKYHQNETERINRVWNNSVIELINEIATTKGEQKEFASRFKQIFKSINK